MANKANAETIDALAVKDLYLGKATIGNSNLKVTGLTANGTAALSITNVGPAGIGTATISKWLEIVDDTGTIYFIPCFT